MRHIPTIAMQKLFLIDAYALIFRFYYAFINSPMRNPEGQNVSAVFGFVKFLNEIIERECPHHLGVAFDPRGGNFRHELFADYKANRSATPEDICASVPIIKEILQAMRIPILEVAGYEADDVIGTLSHKASLTGEFQTFMVTPDKDYGQLVRDNVFIYKPAKGGAGVEILGPSQVCAQFDLNDPRQVIDILAIWGDASDNIPGVPGIGEKGARKLVAEFGSVENIIANASKLSPKQRDSVLANEEQLRLSKVLATISLDVPVEFDPESLVVDAPQMDMLREIYTRHGFRSLLREMDSNGRHAMSATMGGVTSAATPYSAQVPTLFDQTPTVVTANSVMEDVQSHAALRTIDTVDHQYFVVETVDKLRELVVSIKSLGQFCFDTETTSLAAVGTTLVGISIALTEHEAYWIPTSRGAVATIVDELRPIFEDASIGKIGHNLKYDILVLRNYGVRVRGRLFDTMIVHYLLDAESLHSMDSLSRALLAYDPIPIERLIGKGAKQLTMDRVAPGIVADYAAEDADVTLQLYNKLWPKLEQMDQVSLYETIEEPLIYVLADIEWNGVCISREILGESAVELNAELLKIEAQIRQTAQSDTININSPKQLGELLFDRLGIDPKAKKTKTGQYKTDEETLTALQDRHEVVAQILEYRGVKKLLSTYIEALPQLINAKTDRLHTSFNQAVTSTGRLSSSNPNLQNIPIRDAAGRAIRSAFVAADSDSVIISADYSQVELRIMAHLSGDRNFIDAFLEGQDIHTATAAKIFGVPASEVTSEERRKAKTANFGIIYGISGFGLSQRLNIGRAEASELIKSYFELYPGVKKYMDDTIAKAKGQGYVETLFHRRRYLPDINSANGNVRQNAERTAINTPIQGSAADIMKLAIIDAHREMERAHLRAKMILQVHDEIVVEAPREEAERVIEILKNSMSRAATLSVPLLVEASMGSSWMEAH